MMKYWLEHEKNIKQILASKKTKADFLKIQQNHLLKIKLIQHERLVHLFVTLFFGCFSLLSFFAFLILNRIEIIIPAAIFLITTLFYAIHYYRIENATQRWYKLNDQLIAKIK